MSVCLPVLDSDVRSFEQNRKHHPATASLGPVAALRAYCKRMDYPPPDPQDWKECPSVSVYIQRNRCTECKGEGKGDDPMIRNCRAYHCELWFNRLGVNANRTTAGR